MAPEAKITGALTVQAAIPADITWLNQVTPKRRDNVNIGTTPTMNCANCSPDKENNKLALSHISRGNNDQKRNNLRHRLRRLIDIKHTNNTFKYSFTFHTTVSVYLFSLSFKISHQQNSINSRTRTGI